MSTKTRDELVDRALRKLSVVGTGQSASAEDQELVDDEVDPLIDQLSVDGICTITDDQAIPGEIFDEVASLLANRCGPDFSKPFDPNVVAYFEKRIKRTLSSGPTYEPLKVDYF